MRILVTNDDGIEAAGLHALADALRPLGEVVIVAPDRQQSAVGHALTVSEPLRVVPFRSNGQHVGYAVNGTPADCVKLAVTSLLPWRPDVVASGINHGRNTAVNILYSGTVSAATEGTLLGIPSLAFSLDAYQPEVDFRAASLIARYLVQHLPQLGVPLGTLLNVNIPALPLEQIRGIRVTRQGASVWRDWYERRRDPWGREYFWLAGEYLLADGIPDADDVALVQGYVSITPIRYELTDFELLEPLSRAVDELLPLPRMSHTSCKADGETA
ncbi:MAG: 5'/3'-nucleotidase SurE [Candidatus Kapabacteria bacterium]|nr:5'/3'-nucleotidase SurE [Candidatus Kapabacteria bacterium]MCS7169382.1 5'/3'-nucleotidase SurE [Candidatus Kapabacteria bacterium]MDW7996214.1 5'/3'-nucleotidase SurE [Bacteroidota bacterium]MDW8225342.1 5'/3'-nucleotidase SurE [Bacteroidota bacterium]